MGWKAALNARDDLNDYGGEALGLFGLALRFGVEDLQTVAAEAVTDGQNDKKLDIIYVDSSNKSAFLMQCYLAEGKWDKSAPADKATDLHAAASYAFNVTEENLPDRIKSQVLNLRRSIAEGDIDTVYIWYVHNRTESQGISSELQQVEVSAQNHINAKFGEGICRVIGQEVGRNTLQEWYDKSSSQIVVDDEIEFEIEDLFEKTGSGWSCVVTSISGADLFALYKRKSKDLFSLNVRDYLGIVKKDANVNNNIRQTASENPGSFWAFNNGLTAIVHDYDVSDRPNQRRALKVNGIAIVNGAQTTGAIGNLDDMPSDDLQVSARFFKTNDQALIEQIIRYTNSQNAVEASDFRSTDSVQKRLKAEFDEISSADYDGGRRGNISDAIKRRPNLLPSYTVGQALTAFHGDPVLAYNEKSRIWNDNTAYNRIFNDSTTALHIIFVFSLLRSIEGKKKELVMKAKGDSSALSQQDQVKLDLLRQGGAQYLLSFTVSECIELIIQQRVPNKFRLRFADHTASEAKVQWDPIVEVFLAFSPMLTSHLREGLKSNERANTAALELRQTLDSIKQFHEKTYASFKKSVIIA